jgi:hypothetical protein
VCEGGGAHLWEQGLQIQRWCKREWARLLVGALGVNLQPWRILLEAKPQLQKRETGSLRISFLWSYIALGSVLFFDVYSSLKYIALESILFLKYISFHPWANQLSLAHTHLDHVRVGQQRHYGSGGSRPDIQKVNKAHTRRREGNL